MGINNIRINKAKPKSAPFKIYDSSGLFILVHPNGSKYWRYRYQWAGKEKIMALGVYPEVSIANAREARDAAVKMIKNGIDPNLERKKEKLVKKTEALNTFRSVALDWLETQKHKFSPATYNKTLWLFDFIFPELGDRPIASITTMEILAVLKKVEDTGKHETTHRLRQRIRQVYDFAIITERAQHDPTRSLRGVLKPVVTTSRAAITDPLKVGELMRGIDTYPGQPVTRAALLVIALTFLRPGELRRATWPEIDLKNRIWRIPANRMKMKREHIVPLSRQVVSVLEELHPLTGHRPYVFESLRPGRPLSENTLNIALRTMGYTQDEMTAHGFRAMASTLLHEQGYPPEVIELQLAHKQGNAVAAAYNRSQRLRERTEMMQFWADYLDKLKTQNVLKLAG